MNMKKLILFALLMGAMPLQMAAQDDDLYFVPTKKNVEKENARYGLPSKTYYSGSKRTVDDYNRRAWSRVTPIDSTGNDIIEFSAVRGVYPDSASANVYQEPADDYQYTRRMSRFDDYRPAEAYWDGYRAGRYSTGWASAWYDPWYWDLPYYYSSYYGWYSPWYYSTWYSPWRYGYYGYYGPHYYGGWYGGGGRYVPRQTTHRVQNMGGRSYGGYRTGTSTTTRNSGYSGSYNNNGGSSFGGTRSSGSSFGGSRSGGGSFGGGHSTSGGRSFGGRR